MTREEAIEVLNKLKDIYDGIHENTDWEIGHEQMCAIDMAIEALSILRCKDCNHKQNDLTHNFCEINHHKCYDSDFCSWAERGDINP